MLVVHCSMATVRETMEDMKQAIERANVNDYWSEYSFTRNLWSLEGDGTTLVVLELDEVKGKFNILFNRALLSPFVLGYGITGHGNATITVRVPLKGRERLHDGSGIEAILRDSKPRVTEGYGLEEETYAHTSVRPDRYDNVKDILLRLVNLVKAAHLIRMGA